MTFAPNAPSRSGISPVGRTVLFWVMMMVLAVVLWQMSSFSNNRKPTGETSYSDFMHQVDQNNVASITLYSSQSTAVVEGQLRQPPEKFKVTIPKESIPDLTERLRKQGVTIDVASSAESSWQSRVLNYAPFAIILSFWLFMMKQRRAKQMRTKSDQSQPTSSEPSSRPLG